MRNRGQQRDQCDRAGEQHPLLETVLDQRQVVLQCRAEQRLAGRNITTISGEFGICSQYALLPRRSM